MAQTDDNIEQMRAEYQKLHKLLESNKDLHNAFMNDPVVHTWLKRVEMGQCTLDVAMVAIITSLVAQKRVVFDEIVKVAQDFALPVNRVKINE